MLTSCGAQGKTTVFLITDTQIKEESFLEDIDNLLNTGEVPNLFAADEKAEIMEVGILLLVIARGGQKDSRDFYVHVILHEKVFFVKLFICYICET